MWSVTLMMVQLGGSIFDEMLGAFNQFTMLNSAGNSVELHTEELKKKRSSYKHKTDEIFSCRCRT